MGAQPEREPQDQDHVTWISREPAQIRPASDEKGAVDALRAALQTSRGRLTAIGIGLVLAILAVVVVIRSGSLSTPAALPGESSVPLVSVLVPGLQAVTSTITFNGTISARHDMPIGAEGEGGRITAVYVEAGDRVQRGQLLAKLDDSVLRPQINRLAASLEEARANAALADAEYVRARGVEAAGALSAEEIERRRAAAETAAAQVKVAAAQLAEAEARLSRTEVRAPAEGVVLTRTAEVGQTATPGGDPLFRLARAGEVEMRGQVAEQDLPHLSVGQPAQIRLTGVAEPFKGQVRLLGAVIDPVTRLGEIRVALEPHPLLRPGAFARAEVTVGRAQRPVVPQTAVLSDAKGAYVFVVNGDNKVERRAVKVGSTESDGIVIASGLSGNENVVATAGGFLREGEGVAVSLMKARRP